MFRRTCLNPNCGKEFLGRADALTCSPACRMARNRIMKRLRMHSVDGLLPQSKQKLREIEAISPRAHRMILEIVRRSGCSIADSAISAAYAAADDCMFAHTANQPR